MEETKGVAMTDSKKSADQKAEKVEAASIHETQTDESALPEHLQDLSETPEHVSEDILNPPKPNDDEVKGADNTPIAAPHNADPASGPEDRTSKNGDEVTGDQPDKETKALRLERVSGDEVYGTLGAPASTEDSLASIRKRETKAGRGISAKGDEVTGE